MGNTLNAGEKAKNETQNDDKICNNVCPAIILANNRIDKLKVRNKYEITSMTTIDGNNHFGPPFGINNCKKPQRVL
jgi:hypothetical protein